MVPPPRIVYNRIPLREDENLPAVRNKIEEILDHPSIRLYNPYFFNKWQLFEWLKKSRATRPFIPATRRLRTSVALAKMLNKHPYLFLKPETGKAGMGIMTLRVNHTSDEVPAENPGQEKERPVQMRHDLEAVGPDTQAGRDP